MTFNLFDFTTGFQSALMNKGRNATEDETRAYLMARRERLGLPIINKLELHYAYLGSYRRGERGHCVGATFGSVTGKAWETGSYSILMPGYAVHRARVTMETLDEAGEVIASQTLPVEPKKGGVIWSRDDVRKACGKVAKLSKRQSAPLSPAEPVVAVMAGTEPETAPLAPEAAPSASIAAEPTPTSDVPDILERLAALEARVEALSVEAGPTVAKRERTPAQERAVRRAWAERKARRQADVHIRLGTAQLDNAHASVKRWKSELDAAMQREAELMQREGRFMQRRRETLARARATLSRSRRDTADQRQRADALQAQLVKLRADLADPHQPERASDITRLMRERDEARTALSSVTARATRAEAAVHAVADKLEEMASRVARAEAALRARAA